MLKSYEVTVTYRLHALDETDATSQVMNNQIEPEAIDVLALLPIRPTPKIEMVSF